MATANLTAVVSTKGVDKSTKELKGFTKAANDSEKGATKLSRTTKDIGRSASQAAAAVNGPLGGIASRITAVTQLATSGSLAIGGFGVAISAIGFIIANGVSELDRLNLELAKTDALLKATGFSAGVTAEQLQAEAQAIALNTLASTEGIQQAQAVLLTFNKVVGNARRQAVELSQDLATVFGGTAASQATQLGKALQDPVKGITALNRVGVSFTDTQKEQIELFVEAGEAAKAQAIILKALEEQVGGAGASVTGGLAGAFDTLSQRWSEFTAQVADSTGTYERSISIINQIGRGIERTTAKIADDGLGIALNSDQLIGLERTLELSTEIAELEAKKADQSGRAARATQARITVLEEEKAQIDAILQAEVKRGEAIVVAQEKAAVAAAARKKADEEAAAAAVQSGREEAAGRELDRFFKQEEAKRRKLEETAQKELDLFARLGETKLEETNRIENERLVRLQSFLDQALVNEQEFEAAKTQILTDGEAQRKQIKDEAAEEDRARWDDQNQAAINAGETFSSTLSQGLVDVAKQSKSLGDVVKGTIASVADSVAQALLQQVIQTQVVDRILSGLYVKQTAAEVATQQQKAGLNAFVSTSGAPFPLNLGAPAAAAAAQATAASLGAGVIAAASAREQGGQFYAGQDLLVGERGPELVSFGNNGRVTNASGTNAAMGAQAPANVSLVVIDQSDGAKEFEQSTDEEGRIVLLIRSIVSGDFADSNSEISKSFSGNFNAQRAV